MPLPFELLTISKYAFTPAKASAYVPPSGFVLDATPPTWISVSVTPGWSTFGNCWLGLVAPADPGNAAASAPTATPRLTSTAIDRRPRIGHPPEHQGEFE